MTRPTDPLLALSAPTPAGPLTVIVDTARTDQTVVASGFTDLDALVVRLAAPLRDRGIRAVRALSTVTPALRSYADGDLAALGVVPVDQPGGEFLQQCWVSMRGIPAGTTWTYSALATAAGRPTAVRAAGQACARNLVAPFVPCHRVLRTDGSLGGFAYGLDVKTALLQHEGALLPTLTG